MNDAADMAAGSAGTGHGKLQWRILIGFVLGTVSGLAAYSLAPGAAWIEWLVTYVTGPIGQVFLRLLFMLVIPLLFSALVVGIAERLGHAPDDEANQACCNQANPNAPEGLFEQAVEC